MSQQPSNRSRPAPARAQPAGQQAPKAAPRKAPTSEDVARMAKEKGASPGARVHHDEALATELGRNAFSRERFVFNYRVIYVLCGLLMLSLSANVWFGTRETKYRYFATDPEGGTRELSAISSPIQSEHEVLNWAASAITKSWTLSFASYQTQLQDIRRDYTDEGWSGFQSELDRTGNLKQIIASKYVTTATPTGAAVITDQGLVDGRYAWRVELPILVTYQSASGKASQALTIEATVVRRSESENPRGLGIAQVIAK
jgi:intracellular multiplication protein IcmL